MLLLAFLGSASAATFPTSTDLELGERADLIVAGTVIDQWYDVPDVHDAVVVTRTLLDVEEEYKGFVISGELLITTPGGIEEDGDEVDFDSPRLEIGDRILAYLHVQRDPRYTSLKNWSNALIFLGESGDVASTEGSMWRRKTPTGSTPTERTMPSR